MRAKLPCATLENELLNRKSSMGIVLAWSHCSHITRIEDLVA